MTKFEWCDQTINPITGCLNGCTFCYARRFALRFRGRYGYPADDPFRPTFHSDKIQRILDLKGKGKRIFLDSMSDWFSKGVEHNWISEVIRTVSQKPEHTFPVLTKRPDLIALTDIPSNLWLGVSLTNNADRWRLDSLREKVNGHKFVSIEPLQGPVDEADLDELEWVIVGAETGNHKGRIKPKAEWIEWIIVDTYIRGVPLFLKNIRPYYDAKVEEFPINEAVVE